MLTAHLRALWTLWQLRLEEGLPIFKFLAIPLGQGKTCSNNDLCPPPQAASEDIDCNSYNSKKSLQGVEVADTEPHAETSNAPPVFDFKIDFPGLEKLNRSDGQLLQLFSTEGQETDAEQWEMSDPNEAILRERKELRAHRRAERSGHNVGPEDFSDDDGALTRTGEGLQSS